MSHIHRAEGVSLVPAILVFVALFSLSCATSCGPASDEKSQTDATSRIDESRCNSLLETALGGLKPERLGVDSERKATVDNLNQWATDCTKSDETPHKIDPAVLEIIGKVTAPQQMEHIDDSQFSGRDGLHVRNCFLMKRISELATAKSNNNLDRVVDVFEYVNRNIDLEVPNPKLAPNTLYAAVFFGTGAAEDRAWVFASILRQLRIDAFILRPKNHPAGVDEKAAGQRWLVGVPLDGEVYLFDMRLGTPVPSAADDGKSVTVRKPATLAAVKEHDELLRALDLPGGRTYPLRAEDLKDISVDVIGEISDWVPRMGRLQTALAGRNSAIVYDPLEDRDGNAGALRRAAEAGGGNWDSSAVALWPYPELVTQRFETRSNEQSQLFVAKDLPFRSPFRFQQTERGMLPVPMGEHQRARIAQLVGDFDAAIANYNNSLIEQNQEHIPGAPAMHKLAHVVAADNATFWTAVSHLEQNDPSAALNTLRKYKRRYQNSNVIGPWMNLCHGLLAQILAGRGEFAAALQELEAIPSTDPEKDGFDLTALRWKKNLGDAAAKSNATDPAATPADVAKPSVETPGGAASTPADGTPAEAPKPSPTP